MIVATVNVPGQGKPGGDQCHRRALLRGPLLVQGKPAVICRRVEPPPAFGLADVVGWACPLRGRPLRIVEPLEPGLRSLGHLRRDLAGCGHISQPR
jgi:hypothetical protein